MINVDDNGAIEDETSEMKNMRQINQQQKNQKKTTTKNRKEKPSIPKTARVTAENV